MTSATVHNPAEQEELRRIYRKVAIRLIPYIFLCYIFNYLDRVNVGFAKLQMLGDLGMSEAAYGLGAGIFFLGYVACGIPSNLMLQKVGARRWLATIMVLWGSLSTALMFVRTEETFYLLRVLTGAAEAGFFPGIVLYLGRWFPSAARGRAMALFMAAIPLSGVFGGPFSGWILDHFAAGQQGLAGWQWLFLLQGLPTVLLGIGILFVLDDNIANAKWLTRSEQQTLEAAVAADEREKPATASDSFARVLREPAVWILGLIYFAIQSGTYAINFWLPTIIQSSGFANPLLIGWLSAIPYLAAAIFMQVVGRSADRRGERRWHLAVPMLVGATGLVVAATFATNPFLALFGLTLAAMGALTGLPMMWPLAGGFLRAGAIAGGVALINSVGQMAGFLSPYLVGWIKETTQSTDIALYLLAGIMVLGAAMIARLR